MAETITTARADTLRYWVGLPLEDRLNDVSCNRAETAFERGFNQVSYDVTAVEARPEYVLLVVEGPGVSARPKQVTDRLNTLITNYNQHPRPTNDLVALDVRAPRRVGTLGVNGAEADLEDARDLLRDLGAADPTDVSADGDADGADAATADAGGNDE